MFAEAYFEPSRTFEMELFVPLIIVTNSFILDVWKGSEWAPDMFEKSMFS